MKKVMSVSVDERVIELAKDAAHELRISFSAFVEEAIRAKVDTTILEFANKPKRSLPSAKRSSSDFFNPQPKDKVK